MSSLGKAFETKNEAREYKKKLLKQDIFNKIGDIKIRKMSKKNFPRRKKRYHVGTEMQWLNFA